MKSIPLQPPCRHALWAVAILALGAVHMPALAQAPSAPGAAMPPMDAGSAASAGSQALHHSMMSSMQSMHEMKPTGDTDRDFATMMKMHHQHAVEMAKVELQHGKSPQLKAMARKMVKDQTREIGQLDAWLKKQP